MFILNKLKDGNKPIIIIAGFAVCILLIILGLVIEKIISADGLIAVISIIVGFLVLAASLIIENIRRKKAAAAEDAAPLPAESQRFLRHTEAPEDDSFPAGFSGEALSDGFENDDFSADSPAAPAEPLKPLRRPLFNRKNDEESGQPQDDGEIGRMSPQKSLFARRRPAADEQPAYDAPEPLPSRRAAEFSGDYDEPYDPYDPDYDSGSAFDRYADDEDDLPADDEQEEFAPALRFEAPEEQEDEPEDAEDDLSDADDETAAQDEESTAEPAEQPAPAPAVPAPVPAAAPAAVPAAAPAAVAAAAPAPQVVGQTLESFYENMSEEDLLYRDCVEVWAADAKPCLLRLMKYIEGIEDKHTAALFGRECEYVNAMIDRIYCFTQLDYVDELLELKEYNFSTLVKECLRRFSPFLMEKRIGLLWKGLDVNVMTDRRWFVFALTQIIFNSVEFTPEGGKIAISARQKDGWIDLLVDDSGKGISSDEMPYVFVAGYMGDESPNESGRRTGMGLFIARSVINKMGGDVFAESNPGKGTRVIIRLPYIKPAQ